MPLGPVALYGLEVPPGDLLVPATPDFPASFRITMAAIDPSAEPQVEAGAEGSVISRATLKIVRVEGGSEEGSEDDEDAEEYMRALLAESDSDDSESDEEANGGPSDPSKSKKARKQAALEQLMDSIKNDEDSDEEMEDAINGAKANKKGKAKATSDDEEDSDDESDDGEELVESEEFVLCTLDTEKHYQQTLDITVAENEKVYFKVSGTHTVYITGNFLIPEEDGHNHHHEVYDEDDDEDDGDYDLSPDEDELDLLMDGDESDELDEFENPRITEVESEDEAPKLVAKAAKAEKKGKNKRSADEIEGGASLDDIIAKSVKPESAEEPKLSKKQLKKLKKNNGEAAAAKVEESTPKSDKKVQFAKNLEQGPTGSQEKAKPVEVASTNAPKLVNATINGVKIEDKKLGKGPACKKGNKIGMRYIGKLQSNGKVFDSNKSGKPFSFKLGVGEVIKGWDIGVAGMAVGGERRLTIPASLAYRSSAQPGIPPNSTLVFDIKCLEIK